MNTGISTHSKSGTLAVVDPYFAKEGVIPKHVLQ